MRRMIRILAAVAVWFSGAPSAVFADVVELKTGQRVEGSFKQATPAGVAIEVGGQTITFPQDKVRAIYFGAGPTGSDPYGLDEAIRALRTLQSVAGAGTTYETTVRESRMRRL